MLAVFEWNQGRENRCSKLKITSGGGQGKEKLASLAGIEDWGRIIW